MENDYLGDIERDEALRDAVWECLPALRKLKPAQVETLVFFLKGLFSFYPRSENSWDNWDAFSDKLEQIKDSPEQASLQKLEGQFTMKGIFMCMLAGAIIVLAVASLLEGQVALGTFLAIIAVASVFFADIKFFTECKRLNKEQDRKYFPASIREARACNELDWAGLFAFHKGFKEGPLSVEDEENSRAETRELKKKLREALYNDDDYSYSPSSLRGAVADLPKHGQK